MENWDVIRSYITNILLTQNYNGTRCFLTAYQIAVLLDEQNPNLKGDLPLGELGIETSNSFTKQIAWRLSEDIKKNRINGIEKLFLSTKGLESFDFNKEHIPSAKTFSIFRIPD
ncbi:MAG: hypothetical protein PHZ09_06430 [Eubacteriales bacterium]|jgi:hypothetical protein|nr:hypothetical protein [Eubacteriales bacterium]